MTSWASWSRLSRRRSAGTQWPRRSSTSPPRPAPARGRGVRRALRPCAQVGRRHADQSRRMSLRPSSARSHRDDTPHSACRGSPHGFLRNRPSDRRRSCTRSGGTWRRCCRIRELYCGAFTAAVIRSWRPGAVRLFCPQVRRVAVPRGPRRAHTPSPRLGGVGRRVLRFVAARCFAGQLPALARPNLTPPRISAALVSAALSWRSDHRHRLGTGRAHEFIGRSPRRA